MPLIKTTNLKKTYCSSGIETHAVQDVSFEVGQGEVVGIIGEDLILVFTIVVNTETPF